MEKEFLDKKVIFLGSPSFNSSIPLTSLNLTKFPVFRVNSSLFASSIVIIPDLSIFFMKYS